MFRRLGTVDNLSPRVEKSVVFSFTQGQDLCTGTYYNNAVPVVRLIEIGYLGFILMYASQIDEQLAKQGYRLAIWLNTIFG